MTLNELEDYFKTTVLPKEILINRSTRVIDVPKFVSSHLLVLRQNETRPAFAAFWDRLFEIKNIVDRSDNF